MLANEEPSYVGVLLGGSDNENQDKLPLQFFSEDKQTSIILNSKGLFIDDTFICGWGRGNRAIGMDLNSTEDTCPNDSPIRHGSYYNMGGFEPAGSYYTGVRINSLKDGIIEIPYRGKLYSGDVTAGGSYQIKVFPGKGSKIEKQVEAEYRTEIANRTKELESIGLSPTLNTLKGCIDPEIKTEDCIKNFLPSGNDKFVTSGPGDSVKLSLQELYKKLNRSDRESFDSSIYSDFLNCVNKKAPKYHFDSSAHDKVVIFHDDCEWDWGMTCTFERKNGKWIFSEMSWWGC